MSGRTAAQTFQILLVEDNPADVYLFRESLQAAGLKADLTIIENGADGLAFARRQEQYAEYPVPDLAVLDLNLLGIGGIGGISILEAMRQNKDLEGVPVFIMTSSSGPSEKARAMELGIDRFITKPPDLEEYLKIGYLVKETLLKSAAGQNGANS